MACRLDIFRSKPKTENRKEQRLSFLKFSSLFLVSVRLKLKKANTRESQATTDFFLNLLPFSSHLLTLNSEFHHSFLIFRLENLSVITAVTDFFENRFLCISSVSCFLCLVCILPSCNRFRICLESEQFVVYAFCYGALISFVV